MMNQFFSQISLSPREAYEYLKDGAAIVDIRPEYETSFRVFDVPEVIYLPYSIYRDEFYLIPKETPLIIADSVGNQCKTVAAYLMEQGYSQVACMTGGIVEWDRAGLPLKKDGDYEMVGGCACRLQPQKPRAAGSAVSPK
jgi:rhodanese-related sulfurtransferase